MKTSPFWACKPAAVYPDGGAGNIPDTVFSESGLIIFGSRRHGDANGRRHFLRHQ